MIVRKATLADINSIMEIERESFIEGIQEKIETFIQRISVFPEGFLVWEEENCIKGYFCSELWNNIPEKAEDFALNHSIEKSHCKNGTVFYISSYAIREKFRGNGNGSLFFTKCCEEIISNQQAVENSVLLVDNLWKSAVHIYEKNGYSKYAELKNFFPDGNGILMRRKVR